MVLKAKCSYAWQDLLRIDIRCLKAARKFGNWAVPKCKVRLRGLQQSLYKERGSGLNLLGLRFHSGCCGDVPLEPERGVDNAGDEPSALDRFCPGVLGVTVLDLVAKTGAR